MCVFSWDIFGLVCGFLPDKGIFKYVPTTRIRHCCITAPLEGCKSYTMIYCRLTLSLTMRFEMMGPQHFGEYS
jgi:hypothetical protein